MPERLWYLQRCRLFEQLAAADLEMLESRARVRSFARNAPVYLPRERADAVYVLISGRIRLISITEQGKHSILALIEPGDLFGELAVAGAEEREEYAEAAAASTVVSIPRDALDAVLQRNAPLTLRLTRLIGMRRQTIERRLRNVLFRSNRQRMLSLLWELIPRYGRKQGHGVVLDIKLSHHDLAALIGVTRESVTVALGELQSEGLLSIGRQKIIIDDVVRLAAAAGEPVRPPEPEIPLTDSAVRRSTAGRLRPCGMSEAT
jgi:CRP-like cAMP-binding protein